MKFRFSTALLLALALTAFLSNCKKDDDNVKKGESTAFGSGIAETYMQTDDDGNPIEIGISLSKSTYEGIASSKDISASIDLPQDAITVTGFKHAMFDWAQHGHEPAMVYDKPHFDVHFYYLAEAARTAIGPFDTLKSAKVPDPKYFPAGYVPTGHVPLMGNHWVDTRSNEFTPAGFDATLIYGSYDGEQTFVEPMITKKFIDDQKGKFEREIKQPTAYAKPGLYFPTRYGVKIVGDDYLFYMSGFQKR